MISKPGATLRVGNATIEGIGLVIFDKDGTLIELHHYWAEMVRLRAAILRESIGLREHDEAALRFVMGLDDRTGRLRPEGPVGLKTREVVLGVVEDWLASHGYGGQAERCREAFAQADDRSMTRLGDFIRIIDGTECLISNLRSEGCRIALVTVDLHDRAALALDHIGLARWFDVIVGGDEVSRPKPHPEAIQHVLRSLGIAPDAAVMVGDALNDVRMGVEAGLAASIGVLSGFATRQALAAATPFVVSSVADIQVASARG